MANVPGIWTKFTGRNYCPFLIDMERFITEFLFWQKACPLPGVGELQFQWRSATYSQIEQTMIPPMPEIVLIKGNYDAQNIIEYLSSCLGLGLLETKIQFQNWCNNIIAMRNAEKRISGVGTFFADANGNLTFRSSQLHSSFQPEVKAVRIIKKQSVHQLLVGDKERTTEQMSEFYSKSSKKRFDLNWIAAIIIAMIIIIGCVIYFTQANTPGKFGTKQSIPSTDAPVGYKIFP